jgi:Fur family transcriptional regulator, zinc uptake regulator
LEEAYDYPLIKLTIEDQNRFMLQALLEMNRIMTASSHQHSSHQNSACGCDHATDRASLAQGIIADAEEKCAQRSVRLTPIRRKVFETLLATHRPLGAYEIIDELALSGIKRLAPITIYRALDFLLEQGFIHRLSSRNAFIACPHHHGPHELITFLICEGCGGVDEIASTSLSSSLESVLDHRHFKARSRIVEIVGLCGHCPETSSS